MTATKCQNTLQRNMVDHGQLFPALKDVADSDVYSSQQRTRFRSSVFPLYLFL